MNFFDDNPLVNNYNESKVNITTISNNLKKSRNFLIFSAIICGLLGGLYSAAFYMIYINGYPFLFKILNYINFIALLLNSIFGLITVCKSNEKYALYYYLTTIVIFRISILYQLIRIGLIFGGEFTTSSDNLNYVLLIKLFALISLVLSIVLYHFVTVWAKFFFLILKSYVTLFNRILTLEGILKISPSYLAQFYNYKESDNSESIGRDSYIKIATFNK